MERVVDAVVGVCGDARVFDGEVHRTSKQKKVVDLPGGISTSLGTVNRLRTVVNG